MNDRPATGDSATPEPYRVLARKYRPASFRDLIGQEAMVRTLTNAMASGRIAQAYLLTGVRGVGKTTTARIIARALNCVGPDGNGGPTIEPCGVCDHCRAIAEDRHVDVLEMDAASRTGVGDIRELIEGVRYRPSMARFKIYIIDEVHMLSTAAFNALLKTLEEPPPHVKFVFATTEVRKIPVTVLSRCQRFDLRRVDMAVLIEHFAKVATAEGVSASNGAIALIARAADGSVRDGLSLLDQAIALAADGSVDEAAVRNMLGLADRVQVFDLFEHVMAGETKATLDLVQELYRSGADPAVILQDLLDLTHWLTRIAVVPDAAEAPGLPEAERTRGSALARRLALPALARAWQMLLKGLTETQTAPNPLQAAEMALIRLMHAAPLPTPGELVAQLTSAPGTAAISTPSGGGRSPSPAPERPRGALAPSVKPSPEPSAEPATRPSAVLAEELPQPESFEELVSLFADKREVILHAHLVGAVHLVQFEPGRIEFRAEPQAPANLANRLAVLLHEWTGRRWVVAVSDQPGAPTLAEHATTVEHAARAEALNHPLVVAVLQAFPGAVIEALRRPEPTPANEPAMAPGGEGETSGAENRE
jgi:DNA polymerase-3 subunit gamma/tau